MNKKRNTDEILELEYDVTMYKRKPIYSFIKRLFDIITSLLGLIILLPLFILLTILIKIDSKGPALYGHVRVGKNGKMFKVYKFRSMRTDANDRPLEEILTPEQLKEWKRDFKITNDPRVTKIGKILRKTSLDELPQLLNILLGNMSLIGWRPILTQELENYKPEEQELLLKVKPGLTGYWASHGRSNTTYAERIKMELYYAYKRSICLDIKIFFATVIGVFKHEGAK